MDNYFNDIGKDCSNIIFDYVNDLLEEDKIQQIKSYNKKIKKLEKIINYIIEPMKWDTYCDILDELDELRIKIETIKIATIKIQP